MTSSALASLELFMLRTKVIIYLISRFSRFLSSRSSFVFFSSTCAFSRHSVSLAFKASFCSINSQHFCFISLQSQTASLSSCCARYPLVLSCSYFPFSSRICPPVATITSWYSLSSLSNSEIRFSLPVRFRQRLPRFFPEASSCSCRQVVLVTEQLFFMRGVTGSWEGFYSRGQRCFLPLAVRIFIITMIKLIVALLLVLVVEGTYSSIDIQEEIVGICGQIVQKLAGIQKQMGRETDRMNNLLVSGHINTKDPYTAKPEEITRISKEIEKLAREMQAIYDDKDYLQFCVLFEEEKQYKEYNQTELNEAAIKLKKIIGEDDEQL